MFLQEENVTQWAPACGSACGWSWRDATRPPRPQRPGDIHRMIRYVQTTTLSKQLHKRCETIAGFPIDNENLNCTMLSWTLVWLQVEYIISEARMAEKLCLMYEGWMAWVWTPAPGPAPRRRPRLRRPARAPRRRRHELPTRQRHEHRATRHSTRDTRQKRRDTRPRVRRARSYHLI